MRKFDFKITVHDEDFLPVGIACRIPNKKSPAFAKPSINHGQMRSWYPRTRMSEIAPQLRLRNLSGNKQASRKKI